MAEPLASRPTALYRFYDADDVLLYVGITYDLKKRWSTHRLDKSWWHLVSRKTHEWYANRALAEAAEARAIETERPRFDATLPQNEGYWTGGRYEDPRRREIKEQLRADIAAGVFDGQRHFPPSTVLADRYGTSPATVAYMLFELRMAREGRRYQVPRR
jgi:predicted GIY-YIG superfamily endonuclease